MSRFNINPGPLKSRGDVPETEHSLRHQKAWDVPCPRCEQQAGQRCWNGTLMKGVHRERQRAWAENYRASRREWA